MSELSPCPLCNCEYTYEMGALLVCPECAHEWNLSEIQASAPTSKIVKDSAGNVLADGDTVTIIKDMKVKGSSTPLKVGTKVRNIRLVDEGLASFPASHVVSEGVRLTLQPEPRCS